jgi:hypothetical protein
MPPSVAVIVLNWNNAPDTIACLASLAAQDYPCSVLVVDNGSTDGSVACIRDAYPDVEVFETGANLGYAGGNNVGMRLLLDRHPDYLFVLNNDVLLDTACLRYLVQVAEADPKAGFVGPLILQREEPDRIQSAGTLCDRYGNWRQRGLDELNVDQYDVEGEADALVGCAILMRATTLEQIGLLDERFYLYDEDIDWCLRVLEAGWRVRFVPQSKVWHRSSNVRASAMPLMTYYINRNRRLLLRKHPLWPRARLRLAAQQLVWLANWTINPKWRHKRRDRDALFLAMVDAAMGRYGRREWIHHV